jgi:hypothetical protein
MKFDRIKSKICDMINDRFEFENNANFENELLSLADENLKYKEILRIKRLGRDVNSWKTLVLAEIEADEENNIKIELKKAISWLASVKEVLLGNENTDLYLFLAFSGEVCIEECLRIESTEQFCRKYVLLPDEEISEFVNRTFLQELINSKDTIDGEDPLERAFSETATKYEWLSPKIQKTWKKAFADLSGSELVDELLKEEELV